MQACRTQHHDAGFLTMTDTARETRTIQKGEDLFREGEPGTEAYLIVDGYVSVWRMADDQRVDLGTRAEGDIVGEMSLIDDTNCSATVTAQSELVVQILTRDALHKMLSESPELVETILRQFMESLRSANEMLLMYSSRSSS